MVRFTLDEIQRSFSEALDRVRGGETVVIVDADTPVAELRPVNGMVPGLRPAGLCAGQFVVPDDFDAPLPESVLRGFGRP